MKRLIGILCVWGMVYAAIAQTPSRVPAYKGVIERVQPNGDTIYVRLHGDERHHWMTLADGTTLVKENARGYICYAKKKSNVKIVANLRRVKAKHMHKQQ